MDTNLFLKVVIFGDFFITILIGLSGKPIVIGDSTFTYRDMIRDIDRLSSI